MNRRGGRAAGFAVSTAIVLGYYILYASGEARAVKGSVSPVVAMWLPNALLVVLGALAIGRVRRDRTVFEGQAGARSAGSPRPSPPPPHGRPSAEVASEAREGRARPATARHARLARRPLRRRAFLQLFALVLASILVLYVLIEYLEISNDIARVRPPVAAILGYFQAKLAPILVDVVPLAFAAAALIAVAGLVRSSESTALLAHGISLLRSDGLDPRPRRSLAGGALFVFAEKRRPEVRVGGGAPQERPPRQARRCRVRRLAVLPPGRVPAASTRRRPGTRTPRPSPG